MKALVVGGNSFVGAALVRQLVRERASVSVLSLAAPTNDVRSNVEWLPANRDDPAALKPALSGRVFDFIFDNIAYESRQVSTLLDALAGRFARYVLTSSVDINGHQYPRLVTEHEAALEPNQTTGWHGNERYLRGKRACESLLRASGVAWTAVRPAMVVGLHDNIASPGAHLLHPNEAKRRARSFFLACRVQDGGPILLRQDDQAIFRLVWVDDVARALLHVARHPAAGGRSFNATGDECFSTETFARSLSAAACLKTEFVKVPPHVLRRAGLGNLEAPWGQGPYWSTASNAALKSIGWTPTPAAEWMRTLVETPIPPEARPDWEFRPRELALARRLARKDSRARRPALVASTRPLPTNRGRQPGRATAEATRAWAVARGLPDSHFRVRDGLWHSSLGIGTYMGSADSATDALYQAAIEQAVSGGLNVIDTAINYRQMRSERVVGEFVRSLSSPRESLVISTKGGFVTHDADDPRTPRDCIHDRWIRPGLLSEQDAARGHSIAPNFIDAQLTQSLDNLGLSCVDIYFLHNPEVERAHDEKRFWRDLEATAERLETAARENRVGSWGLATWDGLRVDSSNRAHLPLEKIVNLARRVGGERHHLRVVQMPFNALHPEALMTPTQRVGTSLLPAIAAANQLGLTVYTSASIMQGSLHEPLKHALPTLPAGFGLGAVAWQLARSTPGVTTALAGLRRPAHVKTAIELAQVEPARPSDATMRAVRRSP